MLVIFFRKNPKTDFFNLEMDFLARIGFLLYPNDVLSLKLIKIVGVISQFSKNDPFGSSGGLIKVQN